MRHLKRKRKKIFSKLARNFLNTYNLDYMDHIYNPFIYRNPDIPVLLAYFVQNNAYFVKSCLICDNFDFSNQKKSFFQMFQCRI